MVFIMLLHTGNVGGIFAIQDFMIDFTKFSERSLKLQFKQGLGSYDRKYAKITIYDHPPHTACKVGINFWGKI